MYGNHFEFTWDSKTFYTCIFALGDPDCRASSSDVAVGLIDTYWHSGFPHISLIVTCSMSSKVNTLKVVSLYSLDHVKSHTCILKMSKEQLGINLVQQWNDIPVFDFDILICILPEVCFLKQSSAIWRNFIVKSTPTKAFPLHHICNRGQREFLLIHVTFKEKVAHYWCN